MQDRITAAATPDATASSRVVSLRSPRPPGFDFTRADQLGYASLARRRRSIARGLSIGLVENDASLGRGPARRLRLDRRLELPRHGLRRSLGRSSPRASRRFWSNTATRRARRSSVPGRGLSGCRRSSRGTATWTRSASAVPEHAARQNRPGGLTNIARARATCGERAGSRRPGTRCGDHAARLAMSDGLRGPDRSPLWGRAAVGQISGPGGQGSGVGASSGQRRDRAGAVRERRVLRAARAARPRCPRSPLRYFPGQAAQNAPASASFGSPARSSISRPRPCCRSSTLDVGAAPRCRAIRCRRTTSTPTTSASIPANFTPFASWVAEIAASVKAAPASVIDCAASGNSSACLADQAKSVRPHGVSRHARPTRSSPATPTSSPPA